MTTAVLQTTLEDLPVRRGKVRDIYDFGDQLLLVSTDRISAFDWVLPTGIPDKGRVLTLISEFWFEQLDVPNHLLSTELDSRVLPATADRDVLAGRSMFVRKCDVVPIECVVRGYLEGSSWVEYQQRGTVCGIELPPGLSRCSRLTTPIFTPAIKVDEGHDININFDKMAEKVGAETARILCERSIAIYERGSRLAAERGIIIADTKLEWGWFDGELILIDELLTPDSSRFWPAAHYEPGKTQPSFDKQYVRDWLAATDWDRNSPPPALPPDVVEKTREKYVEAYERLTRQAFPWK